MALPDHFKLEAGAAQTLEASGAAVANADWGTANDQDLDNTATGPLAPLWDFELNCGFGAAVAAGTSVHLYLVPKLDGTNAADIDAANDKAQFDHLAGSFTTASAGTAARRLTVQGVPLGPYKYTGYLFNESGQQISAAWALKAFPQFNQVVD